MKKVNWKTIINFLITVLTAVASSFCVQNCIGICYEGGLDKNGKPADTRTLAQNQALYSLLESLCLSYPDAEILGHRDLPNVHKDCPSFDVKRWLKVVDFHI